MCICTKLDSANICGINLGSMNLNCTNSYEHRWYEFVCYQILRTHMLRGMNWYDFGQYEFVLFDLVQT